MGSHYWVRAYYTALTSDDSIRDMVAFCTDIGATGVLLFTQSFDTEPGLLSLDEIHKRAAHLKTVVPRFRDAGFEVHINVMSTLGHGAPSLATTDELGFDPMTDHLGNASPWTPCPLDPRFLDYVTELYGHMARTRPRAVWVDDDVRYFGHGTPGIGCFCERHLELIRARLGKPITRERLVERIEAGSEREQTAWLAVNGEAMRGLAEAIARGVRSVDPEVRIGLMTVGSRMHAAEGRDTPELLSALNPQGLRWLRPGSGFWTDERPLDVVAKTEDCLRQIALAGADVRAVSEVENYPYSLAGKSRRMLHLELTLNAFAGCADQSLNLFHALGGVGATDGQSAHPSYGDFFAAEKPWLDAIAEATQGLTRRGIGIAADERVGHHLAGPMCGRLSPTSWSAIMARLGLPLGLPASSPHLVSEAMADVVKDDELSAMACDGVIVDGPAAERLIRRKLGSRIGVKTCRPITPAGYERFTDDPLNGGAVNRLMSWRHGLPPTGLFGFEANTSAGRVLSRMLSMAGTDLGAGAILTRLPDGGRAAVLPYGVPPTWAYADRARVMQMQAVCRWVADCRLPVTVGGRAGVYPVVWANGDDTDRLVAVANLSFDEATEVEVELDSMPWALDVLEPSGSWQVSEPVSRTPHLVVDIEPWDVIVFRLQRRWKG